MLLWRSDEQKASPTVFLHNVLTNRLPLYYKEDKWKETILLQQFEDEVTEWHKERRNARRNKRIKEGLANKQMSKYKYINTSYSWNAWMNKQRVIWLLWLTVWSKPGWQMVRRETFTFFGLFLNYGKPLWWVIKSGASLFKKLWSQKLLLNHWL